MKKTFGGQSIFLDRGDINTDEIIPAKYLTEVERQKLKPYLLEDLKLEEFNLSELVAKCCTLLKEMALQKDLPRGRNVCTTIVV